MIFKTLSVKIDDIPDNLKQGKIELDFTLSKEDLDAIGEFMELGANIVEEDYQANNTFDKKVIAMGLILAFSMCLDYYKRVENGEIFDDKY